MEGEIIYSQSHEVSDPKSTPWLVTNTLCHSTHWHALDTLCGLGCCNSSSLSIKTRARKLNVPFFFTLGVYAWTQRDTFHQELPTSSVQMSVSAWQRLQRMTLIAVMFSWSYFENHHCLFRRSSCSSVIIFCVCVSEHFCFQQQALWSARVEKLASLETCGCIQCIGSYWHVPA